MNATADRWKLLDLAKILVRDTADRIVFWNSVAEKLYGWSRDEAEGQVSHDLLKTRFPANLEWIKAQLQRSGRWEGKLLHRRKDGGVVAVASQWGVSRDDEGQPLGVVEVNNDVTELNLAEERLRESEQRFRAMFEQAAVGMGQMARDGRWLRANQLLSQIMGYPIDELLGTQREAGGHPADWRLRRSKWLAFSLSMTTKMTVTL